MATAPVDHGLYQLKSVNQDGNPSSTKDLLRIGQNKDSISIAAALPNDVFTSTSSDCKQPNFDIVHARLGHTSASKMQHVSLCKHSLLNTFTCDVYIMVKMHRLPFAKSTITTSSPFQLIHVDVWGPYRVANICGARFFLTIVDDFIRTTWTQFLQNKTQVGPTIMQFFKMVKTQFNTNIATIRSDNGTEFLNNPCLNFFAENGVLHQKSIVGTPQKNGVAKRKHRHLLDTARAIRLQAGLPKQFQGACVLSATRIVKKLPIANFNGKVLLKDYMVSNQPMKI